MIVIPAIGGAAVLAVVALNRLRDQDPEAAAEAVRNVRQLVAVVVVLARATSAVLDALQSARQPPGGVRTIRYADDDWDEAD